MGKRRYNNRYKKLKAIGKGKGSGTWRHAFDAANPWYQILVTCSDWSNVLTLTDLLYCWHLSLDPGQDDPFAFSAVAHGTISPETSFWRFDWLFNDRLITGGWIGGINSSDLKQRHFWAMHINRKWGLFALMLPCVLPSVFTLIETTFLSEGHYLYKTCSAVQRHKIVAKQLYS